MLPDKSVDDVVLVDHLKGCRCVTSGCCVSVNGWIKVEEMVAHVEEAKVLVPEGLEKGALP